MSEDQTESPVVEESDPRRRVLGHLRRLLKAASYTGAAISLAACESCSPMVCDPLPPPINCNNPTKSELDQNIDVNASWTTWVQADAGTDVALVTLGTIRGTIRFSVAPQLTGASLVSWTTPSQGSRAELVCAPDAGVNTVEATIPMTCEGVSQSLTVRLNVSGGRDAGVTIPVTIVAP